MLRKLVSIFARSLKPASLSGFVYVHNDDEGPMGQARTGSTVSLPDRGPPWIVVFGDIASVKATRWPGRLLRVRIIEAASELNQPLPYARYTRCISVRVEAEEDVQVLFGPHGSLVVEVLEASLRIDRATAAALSRSRHPDAPAVYDRAWRAWMEQRGISDNYKMPLDQTLSIGMQGSPIGDGLTLVYSTAFKRAKAVDGDAAFESDDEEVWLAEPWRGAAIVMGDAALALGAPELLVDSDRACLMAGWGALSS